MIDKDVVAFGSPVLIGACLCGYGCYSTGSNLLTAIGIGCFIILGVFLLVVMVLGIAGVFAAVQKRSAFHR